MENLLLVGVIAALPPAIFLMIAQLTGNKLMGAVFLKLPSLVTLVVIIIYLLRKLSII